MIDLYNHYPQLNVCRDAIETLLNMMERTVKNGGKLLICGNGGSCADAEHIVGELMKGFLLPRHPGEADRQKFLACFPEDADYFCRELQGGIPAIALSAHTALSTAYLNDQAPDMVFAQQVYGYGRPGDLWIGISTSGNAANVTNAAKVAKSLGLTTAALTGERDSRLSAVCDCTIKVPATDTYRVQEYHLPVYHYLCAEIEHRFFD